MKEAAAGGTLDNYQVNLKIISEKSGVSGNLKDNLNERRGRNKTLIEEAEETEKRILERCAQLENHQQRLFKLKEKMEEFKVKWISTEKTMAVKIDGPVFEVPLMTPKTPARPPRRVGGTRRAIRFEGESSSATSGESSSDLMKTPCQGTPYRSFIKTPSSSHCCPSAGGASTTTPASYVTRSGRKVKQRTRLIEDL